MLRVAGKKDVPTFSLVEVLVRGVTDVPKTAVLRSRRKSLCLVFNQEGISKSEMALQCTPYDTRLKLYRVIRGYGK